MKNTNNTNFIGFCFLLLLSIVVLIIYLHNQNKPLEYFNDINAQYAASGNIHFVIDNTLTYIETPIFNFQINIDTVDNTNTTTPTYLSVYHHKAFTDNYASLGQYVQISNEPLDPVTATQNISHKKSVSILTSSLVKPLGYNLIWRSNYNKLDGTFFTVWSPISPNGYTCLGDIIIMGANPPPLDYIRCLPITMLIPSNISNGIIWKATNDMPMVTNSNGIGKSNGNTNLNTNSCYCWSATNIDLFKCTNIYNNEIPELKTVYNLPDQYLVQNTVLADSTDISKGVKI